MDTTSQGKRAESLVLEELESAGHVLITTNWRRPDCEIDLVTRHNRVVFFTEVKYRSTYGFGGGLDYITDKKLNQMKYAAERWMQENNHADACILQAAEVDADDNVTLVEC
ncbi:MAG: YraN family protein [Patescibacteria group bacterium]